MDIVVIATTAVFVLFYLLSKFLSNEAKKKFSPTKHIVEPEILQRKLHINDKETFLERIDYYIENNEYGAGKELCTIYTDHHGQDPDIERRSNFIEKRK